METDMSRDLLYVSDKENQRVYFVDLGTGLVERYFDFDTMPERMQDTGQSATICLSIPKK